VLIACEDVTERKRAEVELAKTEQRLRAVIATAPIILFALDRSGVCTLSEGEGLDDLGLKPGQVVGQSVFDLYRDAPQVPSAVRRALAGETFTELLEVNDQILETHYIPVFDGEQVAGINGVAINITQHKRAEDSLRNIQAELAHMARVTMLGEMTALIAHETNQPLGAMVNNANACLRWLAANNLDEARHSAELIRADGYRAAEIINRIRSFAKKAPPQKDWIEINETIREVSALARSEI
jgi:PAS domain S-box-containing protein